MSCFERIKVLSQMVQPVVSSSSSTIHSHSNVLRMTKMGEFSNTKSLFTMKNRVHVLFDGYSYDDPDDVNYMRANCSCTLIQTENGRNIIVDTMTAWDGERIKEALTKYDVTPKDMYAVVGTHGHSDHVGCHYLFQEARWHIMGACVSQRDQYLLDWTPFGGKGDSISVGRFQLVGPDVVVERTPGHTLACVSVIVRDSNLGGIVGICGDLFEREEDILKPEIWIGAGSENIESQREQRLRMIRMCDFIVPGHGPGFKVTEEMRKTLQEEYDLNKKKMINSTN